MNVVVHALNNYYRNIWEMYSLQLPSLVFLLIRRPYPKENPVSAEKYGVAHYSREKNRIHVTVYSGGSPLASRGWQLLDENQL